MQIFRKLLVMALIAGSLAAVSPAVSVAATTSNGCVKTQVWSSNHWLYQVRITNVCSYTLTSVRSHVFNGPAGLDRWWPTVVNITPGAFGDFKFSPNYYAPSGSLTCGEIVSTSGHNWGRDCITM
jgi:hypothetical protein